MTGFPSKRPGSRDPVAEQAAAWVLRQEQGELSAAHARDFADWLAADDSHSNAYDDALWALDAAVRHAGTPELMGLRGAALAARGSRRRFQGWAALSGLAAAVAGLAIWTTVPPADAPLGSKVGDATRVAERSVNPNHAVYGTNIGERAAIKLPDGSVVTLDTDTRIRVAYHSRERAIYLLKGQALFEVAHGQPAPFQVYAKDQRVTAVGTVFNVRLGGDEVRVATVEGVVKVRTLLAPSPRPRAPNREFTLTAGEALVARPQQPLRVAAVDVEQVVSWKGGLLVFNDMALSDAVAEINRYTARPIAIADVSIGGYRVSGVFKSTDPERFSRAMSEVLPVVVTYGPDGAPALRAKSD